LTVIVVTGDLAAPATNQYFVVCPGLTLVL
jgi:hypothetical protein